MFLNNKYLLSIGLLSILTYTNISYSQKAGTIKATEPMNLGRLATEDEIKSWDIDVRPDLKGLPKGSGSVERGEELWLELCSSCHGDFGESNEVFTPIIGGTTEEDIETGRVADLIGDKHPQRSMMMKVATISTIWDYVYRAMPWNAPRTLSVDDTYALVAYILNLAYIVDYDHVLSDQNIHSAQNRLPNRKGMTVKHGLWHVKGQPDIKFSACMTECDVTVEITSQLPEYAKDAHGDLSKQSREFGPFQGRPLVNANNQASEVKADEEEKTDEVENVAESLLQKNNCAACHKLDIKFVGPSYSEISKKYENTEDNINQLAASVKNGSTGNWGVVPMPPNPTIPDQELKDILEFILNSR